MRIVFIGYCFLLFASTARADDRNVTAFYLLASGLDHVSTYVALDTIPGSREKHPITRFVGQERPAQITAAAVALDVGTLVVVRRVFRDRPKVAHTVLIGLGVLRMFAARENFALADRYRRQH